MRDRETIAALYDRHAPRLYAIALRITSDAAVAAGAIEAAFRALVNEDAIGDPGAFLVHATRDCALARQTQPAATDVLSHEVDPRLVVEDAWFGGMTIAALAARYGLPESRIRELLQDGMAALRAKVRTGIR